MCLKDGLRVAQDQRMFHRSRVTGVLCIGFTVFGFGVLG